MRGRKKFPLSLIANLIEISIGCSTVNISSASEGAPDWIIGLWEDT
jgi:hypothetical protein